MAEKLMRILLAVALMGSVNVARAEDGSKPIVGSVADGSGKALHGVMITAFDTKEDKNVSVFSKDDGKFNLDGLPAGDYQVRARLLGLEDELQNVSTKGSDAGLKFTMKPASDMQAQRPGSDRLGLLKFASEEERVRFRFACTYCHQIGSEGFRSPEELVDWEVMLKEVMSGPDGQQAFKQLPKDLQEKLPKMLFETFSHGAEKNWPPYTPPPAPSGEDNNVRITEWPMGQEDVAMMHDLEIGDDGLVYTIDSTNDAMLSLNPKTGERVVYSIPGGKEAFKEVPPLLAPHSIEKAQNGDMWITLCYGKQMARFTPSTKEWKVIPSGEGGRKGGYPHTLRFDQKDICWYTDAAMGCVFRLDPSTLQIKQYKTPGPGAAVNMQGKPITDRTAPVAYGMSIAPDGKVWYTKLNGNRVGVIDPKTDEVKEWKPPVIGPRRHEVAPDGIVWIPGFVSADICKFNPATEEWKNFDMPTGKGDFPYALSVDPKTGQVWVCGTNSDTIMRFDPKSEKWLATYRMPSHVTYTREIEFAKDGSVWSCNSNLPARHIEAHKGSIVKIEVLDGKGEPVKVALN